MSDIVEKFRKRPLDVEATQFVGGFENASEILEWISKNGGSSAYVEAREATFMPDGVTISGWPEHLIVNTKEGPLRVDVGSWVIKGVIGEFYPCLPNVFDESYDKVG